MNRNALVAVVLSVACTACVKEIDTPVQETLVPHEYKISIDNSTKTTVDATGKLSWAAGDVIRYYSTSNGAVSSATVTESGPSTSLTMNVVAGAHYLVAAYGGTGISQNTSGNSFVLNGVLGAEQSGKFEDAHIAVVKTYDVNDASLHFVNVTSLVKFTLERDDVAYVVFKSNDDTDLHGDGTLHFSFSDVEHSASLDGSTANNVKVNVGDAGTYYISALPCTMENGFTMSLYKSDESYIGKVTTDKSVSLSKNKILNLGTLDARIDTTPVGPVGPVITYEPNLSLNGTANCYIIPVAGEYYFDATVKGSSSESIEGNGDYAEVLWESFGTDVTPNVGDIVNNCRYENGKIYFTSTGENGNAVIALYNRDEEIIWSWHIWCCMGYDADFYAQEYNNNAGTMMDRNLGATSATPGDVHALGLLYQWGRKDPFLGSSSINSSTSAKSTITWPSTVSSTSLNGTIAYATSHPTTFITYNSYNSDWYYTGSSSTDILRWNNTKGLYDPCPAGYRVSYGGLYGVWAKAFGTVSNWGKTSNWDAINKGMDFGKTDKKLGSGVIWYPASGYLSSSSGSLYSVGYDGSCWSCSSYHYNNDAYYFYFSDDGYVYPSHSGSRRATGFSVRCVKED